MCSVFDRMAGDSRRPRSTATGFDDHLRDLFPEIAGDAAYASQLAEEMALLRRELPFARAREALEEERQAAGGPARAGLALLETRSLERKGGTRIS